jgi:ferredoxin
MAYYITDDCISCSACEPECPNQAINEGETIYIINPDRCTECVGAYESSAAPEYVLWTRATLIPQTS